MATVVAINESVYVSLIWTINSLMYSFCRIKLTGSFWRWCWTGSSCGSTLQSAWSEHWAYSSTHLYYSTTANPLMCQTTLSHETHTHSSHTHTHTRTAQHCHMPPHITIQAKCNCWNLTFKWSRNHRKKSLTQIHRMLSGYLRTTVVYLSQRFHSILQIFTWVGDSEGGIMEGFCEADGSQ